MSRTRLSIGAVAIVMVLLVGACRSGGSSNDSAASGEERDRIDELSLAGDGATAEATAQTSDDSANSADRDASARSDGAESGAEGGGLAVPAALTPVDIGRSIVFSATIAVEVEDIVRAGDEALFAMQGLGGLLFAQQTTTYPEPQTVLTFKVLPTDFQEALRRLGGLGELVDQAVSADDVTDRVVDLESRITTSAASVERLRALLGEAGNLDEVARLEAQLLDRETQLEQLRGQLRTLSSQVDLATIVLTLTPSEPPATTPAVALVQTAYAGHDSGAACPGTGGIDVDRGAPITVCFAVTNTGNAALTSLLVEDDEVGVSAEDLKVVAGDPTSPLEPGDGVVFAYDTHADGDLTTRGSVVATPVDEAGSRLADELVEATSSIEIVARGAKPLPGFSDTVESSVDALQTMIGVLLIAVAILLPFVWLLVAAAVGVWLMRRRRSQRDATPAAAS